MRALITCIVLAMPLNPLHAQNATKAPPTTLGALRDQARPLLVFAGAQDTGVEQQYRELASHADAMRDRDMRVILISASQTHMHQKSWPLQASLSNAEQQQLRQRFNVQPDEFAVILVGKDGGEKLRSNSPLPWAKLASTIDAMPMRRDEMRGH